MSRATALARYWRQVHQVQKMTGTNSRDARAVVRTLRDTRGFTSANATRQHPFIVRELVRQQGRERARQDAREGVAPEKPKTLDRWRSLVDDGYYDEYPEFDLEGAWDY